MASLAPLFGPARLPARSPHLRKPALADFETGMGQSVALRSLRRGCRTHPHPRGHRIREELPSQLPARAGPPVRSARPRPGPRRLIPLVDEVPRRRVHRAVSGQPGRHPFPSTFLAAAKRPDVSVPHGLDHPPPHDRRIPAGRRRHHRAPQQGRGPLCVPGRAPDPLRLRSVASQPDVAGHVQVVRRWAVGSLFRRPPGRGRARPGRLAGH